MIRQTYHLEIITPCFCAGADQAKAEIRAASIRGQLRWWFRVLGGSRHDEMAVFGTVAGDDDGRSSAVTMRIANFESGPVWPPPQIDQNKPENYIWHFASVSGTTGRGKTGPRWCPAGVIPPQSTFELDLLWRRSVSAPQRALFDIALNAFLAFGTLGLRGTRGLGAFSCKEASQWQAQIPSLTKAGFVIAPRQSPETFSTWQAALKDWSSWLRYSLRKEHKAVRFSALGGISPRQASAIHFRPIKLPDGWFTWLAFEAPHKKVLDRNVPTLLHAALFKGSAPIAPATRRRE